MFYSCILFLIDRSLIFVCVIYCFYICVPVLYDVILISCICPFIFIVITVVCLSLKLYYCIFFFFTQKTAYDVRIIDWSADVCSSDLADWVRDALQEKGITPCIPGRKIRNKTVKYDKRRYKRRNRIEIMFGRLKDWRRVATRYDRCPRAFFSAIALAATVIFWL